MSSHDRDDRIEELLRSTLHEEAETVTPTGDGLSRIQQRITQRGGRQRWLRPTLALGSAVVVVAAGFGAYAAVHGNGSDKVTVPPGGGAPTPSVTPSTTPPTTTPVAQLSFPGNAIFPFTTVAQQRVWQRQFVSGHQPWIADPVAVATSWVTNYLQQPTVDRLVQKEVSSDGQSAAVTLGRVMTAEQKTTVPVTVVDLQKFRRSWIVVGAADPQNRLSISSPAAGTLARSPLTVTGPAYGVDESVRVEVRNATAPASFGSAATGFGNGSKGWSVAVPFSQPPGPDGVIVATEDSAADGGPARIAAEKVTFGEASGSPAPPQFFYAAKSGRIAEFRATDGSFVQYVTDAQPGGGASDPQLSDTGESVYYLQGAGTCANALMSVNASGGTSAQSVATPDAGYVITGYAVGPVPAAASGGSSPAVAAYETACDSAQSPEAKLVTTDSAGTRHSIAFGSVPPGIHGDPVWLPRANQSWLTHALVAFIGTGTSGYLGRYDTATDTSSTPSRNACAGYDVNNGLPAAVDVDGSRTLWFAVETGTSMQVLSCAGGSPKVEFTVPGNATPADLDLAANGVGAMLTDTDGHVWRWDGSGTPTKLAVSAPTDNVTW